MSKKLVRTFNLNISNNLIYCKKWAREVIQGIENDQLSILNRNESFSLALQSKDSPLFLDSYFKKRVSIKEWLPIACQNIRSQEGLSDEFDRKTAVACYKTNAAEVLFPHGRTSMPPGPVAFNGAIVFKHEFIHSMTADPIGKDRFKFVLAHELVHVFDFMRLLIPAFQDGKRFWKICLEDGYACDEIDSLYLFKNLFVDSYGTENELFMVSQYWPKKAKKWYDAFRGINQEQQIYPNIQE